MIQFNSLNTIIDDILNEVRNNSISESESLSRNQVEQWIIQYRSMLIKQDIDKGREINPDYIQEILNIPVTDKDSLGKLISTSGSWVGRTTIEIPNGIDFHFADNIISITDKYDSLIQVTSESRAKMQEKRRYTGKDTLAYERDGRIYITGQGDVTVINIKGVFENPLDPVFNLTADDRYPIPANMIIPLKELIITKEIDIVALSDDSNDSNNDLTKTALTARDYKKMQRGIK